MKIKNPISSFLSCASVVLLATSLLSGCQSTVPEKAMSRPAAAAKQDFQAIRIKAGASDDLKDTSGNVWLADRGFTGGDTVERADLTIANTTDQRIYQSERYSMTQFTQALPNGKYTVKLHFCETYDGITGPGQRIFSFNVAGQEFKNFDVWAKAGGGQRAYVETVPVEITNGKLVITFTPDVENPQINGIEILPAS
jgi:endoglucanase